MFGCSDEAPEAKPLFLRLFRAVFASLLFPVFHANRVQNSSDYMVSDSGQVLHPASSYDNNGVFLQIVAFARDISGNFHAVGQSDPGDFSQGRVWFFGSSGGNFHANSSFERRGIRHRPVP